MPQKKPRALRVETPVIQNAMLQDNEAFRQLRQQLQPLLSQTHIRLLQRIQGRIGTGEMPVLKMPKLTKKQIFRQGVNKYL